MKDEVNTQIKNQIENLNTKDSDKEKQEQIFKDLKTQTDSQKEHFS